MSIYTRIKSYPRRAWLVSSFLAVAFLLGGGEAKSPAAELALETVFAIAALGWIWSPREASFEGTADNRIALLVPLLIVAIPILQLIPLPPLVWHELPGRDAQVAALSVVGATETWRPLSEVPSRTLATLLSMIPPLGVFYAVTRLDLRERSLVPRTVLVMALLTAFLGGLQLLPSNGALTFYQTIHAGWVTGFQSNRNHAADVLLAGLLACAYTAKRSSLVSAPTGSGAFSGHKIIMILFALLLLTALVMTGSRAGVAMGLLTVIFATAMLFLPGRTGQRFPVRTFAIALGALVVVAGGATLVLLSDGSGVTRVAARFADMGSERGMVWADAAYAWDRYWPMGIGAGGFIAAMFPAESLEFVNATFPNQAHNDYLEIGIEAGITGYLVLLAVWSTLVVLAIRNAVRDDRTEARLQLFFAGTVLILLMLHSVVDYPLRSMSLACLAGAAAGMLMRAGRLKRGTDAN